MFKINSKINAKDNKQHWIVKRFEDDFYKLRNILVLSFGQCFIPPLTPIPRESSFDKKSLHRREKSFSRFLRSVIRSPELASHPLVLEFLKIDHSKIDSKIGMREFNRKLITAETDLQKMSGFFAK